MTAIKTPSVPSLENALSVLELLAHSKAGLSLSELTRRLEIPKSSAHCLLVTLERRGYVHKNERNRYLFGLKFFSMANTALRGLELREKAAPFLRELMARTHLTVHLAMLEENEAVLVEKVEPAGVFKLATWIGKRMDVHCTALGKALIAYLPEEELDAMVQERGLPRHNENTIGSLRRLRENLAKARTQGYVIDDEEDEIGTRCIGVPVFGSEGPVAAAVSVSGTTSEITNENLTFVAERLVECAASISAVLSQG